MNYTKSNKLAWEEAFNNRKNNFGDNVSKKVKEEKLPFLMKI